MTKEQRIEQARNHHHAGCNCCQAVVLAYSDILPIDSQTAQKVSAPFGRGIAGCREVCGCVSGMAMVCGLTDKTENVRPLIETFRADNGDIVCSRLLQMGKKPCNELVAYAAGLLANVCND
ncbi:MAG: C_GCAxxG_C_C family protein [Bacteroidales bacterium]|nr:C_GCAxxG_C_C family protein [Bacteroidales bacterium]